MARLYWLALGGCALATAACDGSYVNLGNSERMLGGGAASAGATTGGAPTSTVWDVEPLPILPQEEDILLASPTFTQAGQLYFSQQRRYNDDRGEPFPTNVTRATPTSGSFGPSERVPELEPFDISSPAVSWHGDELWFGMNAGRSTDVFRSVLMGDIWSAPSAVAELNDLDFDDAPRPPALEGTLMPLSSKRHGGKYYQIYFSKRADKSSRWSAPSQELLMAINSAAFQSADGFLDESGLNLYFSSTRREPSSDLYVATRASVNDAFGVPQPLDDLNREDSDERMPWLSPDGATLSFVSNRATAQYEQYALYIARKR